jgi:hypothetical protein
VSDTGTSVNALEVILREFDDLLAPVTSVAISADPLAALRRLLRGAGWQITDDVDPAPIVTGIDALVDTIDALVDGVDPDDLVKFLDALDEIVELVVAIKDLIDLIADGGPETPTPAELATFGEDILQYLVTRWIRRKPVLGDVAFLLGLLEPVEVPEAQVGGWLHRRSTRAARLRPEMITELIADPLGYLADRVVPNGWAASADAAATNLLLAHHLDPLLRRVGGAWRVHGDALAGADEVRTVGRLGYIEVNAPIADDDGRVSFGAEFELFSAADVNDANLPGPAVEVAPFGGYSHTFDAASWSLTLAVLIALGGVDAGDSAPALRFSGNGVDVNPSLDARFDIGARIDLGVAFGGKGTRIDLGALELAAFVGVANQDLDVGFSFIAKGSKIVLSAADLGAVSALAQFENTIEFDLGLAWSVKKGVTLAGSASLEIEFTEGIDIGGVITLSGLRIRADIAEKIGVSAVTNVGLNLGPVAMVIEGIGLGLELSFPDGGGNLGGANLGLALKPPKGIGLRVDATVVVGGGYLYLDPDKGEFAGILELSFPAMSLSIKAIGLLTTKMPGGEEGWALLLLVFVEFPAIQLGYGFTLNGVGGILGIQHGVSIDALQAGLRTGAMDNILFPDDPVGRAPQVLNDLRATFPITPRAITFGPALKIGWGQGIVLISLGLVIQLDNVIGPGAGNVSVARIVLLGQLRVKLPPIDDAPAVVQLLVDILGYYDFEEMELGIDARLRDSTLAGLPLTGSLCVRARFGEDPTFIMAVGGFHPRFTDLPPGIPQQDRMGVQLVYGELTISIGCYTAITSNSFQIGVDAQLLVVASDFKVEAYLGFDALFIFTPRFCFIIDFRMGAAVSWKGHDLASIRVKGSLSGPGRWEVEGTASFKILFFEVEIGFKEAWGDAPPVPLVDGPILPDILAELADPTSWHASLPGGRQLVSLRVLGADELVVAHPLGALEGRQKVVPLGLTIEKVRGTRPTDGFRFDVGEVRVGGNAVAKTLAKEHFARGEYYTLSEDDKLTSPSFERFDAGVRIGSDAFVAGPAVGFDPDYETFYLEQPDVFEMVRIDGMFLVGQVKYSATARSKGALAGRLAGSNSVAINLADTEYTTAIAGSFTHGGTTDGTYSQALADADAQPGAMLVVESAELVASS